MNLKQALKRIEELEARVRMLESQLRAMSILQILQPVSVPAVPDYTMPRWYPPFTPMCGPDVVIGTLTGGSGSYA